MGETAGRIIAEQFGRLKHCDRFFYSHLGQAGQLSDRQLAFVRQTSPASLTCQDGGQSLSPGSPSAFSNQGIRCEGSLVPLTERLSAWK